MKLLKKLLLISSILLVIFLASCNSNGPLFTYSLNNDNTYHIEVYGGGHSDVIIPDTYNDLEVTSIEESLFSTAVTLKNITIGKNIKVLPSFTFHYCTGLKTVSFAPDNKLEEISNNVFNNCQNIEEILLYNCKNLKKIDFYAFKDTGLKEIFIPSSVTYIGDKAFMNCKDLVINLEHESIPQTFHENWNHHNFKVNLNSTYSPKE